MSIDDDIALFKRVHSLSLLGMAALNVLAIGAEQRDLRHGEELFRSGDEADAGFLVRRGSFRVRADGAGEGVIAVPGMLIGELALIVAMQRQATATALEQSSVIRMSRSLFQRVLESHPEAARRLRDDIAARANDASSSIARLTGKLSR